MGLRVSGAVNRYFIGLGFSFLIVFVGFGSSSARTWHVWVNGSGNAYLLQAAIDSTADGDSILVHPGTYFGAINFHGKNIVVKSIAGPEMTILDAIDIPDTARVVSFRARESRDAILQGFTITHGSKGGILILDAEPSVIGNIITSNGLAYMGGGIIMTAGDDLWSPLIQGNVITDNRASQLAGGVGTLQRMIPEILDNYVARNEVQLGDGGGIYHRSYDDGAVIRGNVVVSNRAGDHGGGIYAALAGSPPPALQLEMSWNLIANNSAGGSDVSGDSGGGITLIETDAWVHHNTIVANEGGSAPTRLGGGIAVERIGSPLIEQNIIAFTVQGGGVFCLGGATPILRNNLVWQNGGGHGLGSCSTWWQSNGNVVQNPYFCDMAGGDFKVASNSAVMTHPAGPLGVYHIPGCGPMAVIHSTWGSIKAKYSSTP